VFLVPGATRESEVRTCVQNEKNKGIS